MFLRSQARAALQNGDRTKALKLLEEAEEELGMRETASLRHEVEEASLDMNTPRNPLLNRNGRDTAIHNDPAIYSESYKTAFMERLASRGRYDPPELHEARLEHQTLYGGSGTAGGDLLPGDFRDAIITRLPAFSEIVGLATRVDVTGWPFVRPRAQAHGSSPSIYTDAFVGSMVAEVPGSTDGINEPTFGQFTLQGRKYRGGVRLGRDIFEDAATLENFLATDGARNYALSLESQMIAGDGIAANCLGLTNMPTATDGSQTEDEIGTVDVEGSTSNTISNTTSAEGTAPKVLDLYYALPGQYRQAPNCRYVFNSQSEKKTRKLVDANGRFMWSSDGGFGGAADRILNVQTAISEFMPDDGTDGNIVYAIGDWSQMILAVRRDLTLQISEDRYADTDEIGIWLRARFDVGVSNKDAFRFGVV